MEKLNILSLYYNMSNPKSKKPNYKFNLLNNLNYNTYAKLAVFPEGKIGFVAIKKIPPHTNPFVLTNNQNILYDFVELEISEIQHLPHSLKELIHPFLCLETQTYFIPFFGLNTMNFIMYIRFSKSAFEVNLTYDETNLESELIHFKTTRIISKCEELIAPGTGFKFNITKIRSSFKTEEIPTKKRLLLENLSNIFCKIGPTTIPTITGSGVIAVTNIPSDTNPFINTNDACYIYNSVNLSKQTIDNLSNKEVKKIVNDFICPDEKFMYSIPYLGFNSLNVSFFLNHSNKPNLSVVSDKCEYMGFRTNRPILAGEELFINYGDYHDSFTELMSFQKAHYSCEFMIPK